MKRILFVALLLSFGSALFAQSQSTKFILVRHAEKGDDGTKDPDLSVDGKERAGRLAKMLSAEQISAVYSTNFKRTRNTALPLAESKGLAVETYDNLTADQLQAIAAKHKGGTVLICGHSNTTPKIANTLSGQETFTQFDDGDFGNLIVIILTTVGKDASVLRLRY